MTSPLTQLRFQFPSPSAQMAVKIRVLDKSKRSSLSNGLAGTPSEVAPPSSIVSVRSSGNRRAGGNVHRGWVVVLKDTFGFIETEDHSRDIYFNMSNVIGSSGVGSKDNGASNGGLPVTLGCEVEYQLRRHKISTPSTSEAPTNATTPGDAPSTESGELDHKLALRNLLHCGTHRCKVWTTCEGRSESSLAFRHSPMPPIGRRLFPFFGLPCARANTDAPCLAWPWTQLCEKHVRIT